MGGMFETGVASEPRLGALLAVAGLHVVGLWYVYRRSGEDAPDDATPGDRAADVVTCPECGAANELGYRFCRNCVGDLPGADGRAMAAGPSRSDSVF